MIMFRSVLVVAFIAWLSYRAFVVIKLLSALGLGTTIAFNHAPGPCKTFYTNGSEDIDVLPSGLAIVSSGLKYSLGLFKPDPAMDDFKGKIYAYDFNDPNAVLTEFTLKKFDDYDFVPHGIDTYTDETTGQSSLFVVNHGPGLSSVEVFDIDEANLVLIHKNTVLDEHIYLPNDIVAVGPDSFYITNDHYFYNPQMRMVEVFYPLKLGNVVFYNNGTSKIVDTGRMIMPNGINVDKTGKYIFVVDVGEQGFHVFKIMDNNSLEHKQVIFVGAPLDNAFIDEAGNLWGGSSSIAFLDHANNFSKPCPAKAFQVKLTKIDGDNEPPFKLDDIREVFSTDGKGDLRGASSAAFYKNKLLIGTVFGNLMYCDVNEY